MIQRTHISWLVGGTLAVVLFIPQFVGMLIQKSAKVVPPLYPETTLTEGLAEYLGTHSLGTPYGAEHLHIIKKDGSLKGVAVSERNPRRNLAKGSIVFMKDGVIIPLSPEHNVASSNQSEGLERP